MSPLRLAVFVLWALAIVASVLGMGAREDTREQDVYFWSASVFGYARALALVWSVS